MAAFDESLRPSGQRMLGQCGVFPLTKEEHRVITPKQRSRFLCYFLGLALICASVPVAAASQAADENLPERATPVAPHPSATHMLYLPILGADPARGARLSTPHRIEQAFARGEITESERVLYLAYALYEPQSLPAEFHSSLGWYGTQYVLEVQNGMSSARAAAPAALRAELGRMDILAATVCDNDDGPNSASSTNFHFNYATIASDSGLTIADYITSTETTFDVQVIDYGWAKPPLCTGGATCSGVDNPFDRYPIQIYSLGGGLYGYVTVGGGLYTGFVEDNPNTVAIETDALASCMVLNDNFSLFPEGAQGALDATTAHEFVHAIQNGYGDPGTREDAMWYESSASYMEDEVFDYVNSNYYYLWPVVSNSLGAWPSGGAPGGVSDYSNFLFFRHVAEHNGGVNTAGGGEEIMQRFWENVAAGQAALTAYNNALVAAGTTLADAFHRYAIAARFSKSCGAGYAAPYCFEEGAAYVAFEGGLPSVQGSIAANPGVFAGNIRNHYAANWVDLPTSGSPYQVTLHNMSGGGQLRGSLVCDTGSAFTITPLPGIAGPAGSTAINSFSATGCVSVAAVLTNQEQISGNPGSADLQPYSLTVSAAAPTAVTVAGFSATSQPDGVQLVWQTLDELSLVGFHLYRGPDPAGPGERITADPVWAQGPGSLQGYAYGYQDRLPRPPGATIYYWLEELYADGDAIRHGPLPVQGADSQRLYLPAIRSW
jgi:hypothetical protein